MQGSVQACGPLALIASCAVFFCVAGASPDLLPTLLDPTVYCVYEGGHSYSVVEVVTGAILVSYLYWLRGRMSEIRSRIRNSKSLSTLTAADFTVMVSSLPETWKTDDVRKLFERFGEVTTLAPCCTWRLELFELVPNWTDAVHHFTQVVHVSLALNNRELILEMKRTTYLRDRHTEASLHLLNLMSKHAPAKAVRLGLSIRVSACCDGSLLFSHPPCFT